MGHEIESMRRTELEELKKDIEERLYKSDFDGFIMDMMFIFRDSGIMDENYEYSFDELYKEHKTARKTKET